MTVPGGAKARRRRGYLDWMRGVAVLIMIEAHVIDSWTGGASRDSDAFGRSIILGGFGAPLFLFLAGVAVALSAGSKYRRSKDHAGASRAVVRRGLEIFGLAFLFRVQAWVLGWSSPRTLLRVDILNIMGPSIMAAAALWGMAGGRRRLTLFVLVTLAVPLATPLVRAWAPVAALPDPIEAYIRPVGTLSNFVFFPWAAFVFAGAILGLLLDDVRDADSERRLNLWFVLCGGAVAAVAAGASFLPNPYAASYFWTTSPSFFFLRAGLMTAAIGLAYAWESRPGGADTWSPVRQLGRTSLFIYWIHVEMVYGLVSLPLHKSMTLAEAWAAFAVFAGFMLLCSIAKDRAVAWWAARSPGTRDGRLRIADGK